ncbi:DUF4436 family protein [Streptomyces morookaense]|uniref:DUF4436 family protein n=1 Tax=Streptomyces morookaense TaxID=1970 RepID=A0A7Y7B5N3_STRMO|nr:DUF4436 family protein [Streptomyces morookaense]NVK79076.1 DUF4436 family protein [Streptomyces morookaense]GHF10160.1 hypothetical protein GCM10010359_09580 [Streptomyces morookaense]
MPRPPSSLRRTVRHWWFPAVAALLIAGLCAAGAVLYVNERDHREQGMQTGSEQTPDRLDVKVHLLHSDAATQSVTAWVDIDPKGSLRQPGERDMPTKDLTIETSSGERPVLHYPAHQPIRTETLAFHLQKGTISDYPFDRYITYVAFDPTADGKDVPVSVRVLDKDPFFVAHKDRLVAKELGTGLRLSIRRSRSNFLLAWFMMIVMWLMALAVLVGARLAAWYRRGMAWAALSWMAATLFALVALRKAAPGDPPIGSAFDYAAFFWANLIIAASVVYVVVVGFEAERAKLLKDRRPSAPRRG